MTSSPLLSLSLLAAVAMAATGTARAAAPDLRADLEKVARSTVLFGHQSVGNDILDGLRDLSAETGVALRIAEVSSAGGLAPGTFGHVLVAENGDPLRKLASFEAALGAGPAAVDVAFVKFCFVDVMENSDARAIFERYRSALQQLSARHPRTTFVRMTVPLTSIPTGPKAFVKRLLGRQREPEHNVRREEFNALVRGSWQGSEPLFDVARLESTRPDGGAETCATGGKQAPALVPGYTHDGGHLNPAGRRKVAAELVHFLAALPARESASR